MIDIKKALCPVDFSASTEASVEAAVGLARAYGAELYLLHVVEGPAPPENAAEPERAAAAREAVRERLASLVAVHDASVMTHYVVADGAPAEEILRLEELFGIDLVVIAPHGRPTLGKIIFGSVADKVTRGSNAHVFLVRTATDDGVEPSVA